MGKLTDKEVKKALAEIRANLAFEGMILTEDELEVTEKVLRGEMTSKEAIDYYLKEAGIKSNEQP